MEVRGNGRPDDLTPEWTRVGQAFYLCPNQKNQKAPAYPIVLTDNYLEIEAARSERRLGPAELAFGSACLLVLTEIISPFLLSISMWGLVFSALWQCVETAQQKQPPGANKWWGGLRLAFQNFSRQPVLLALALLLAVPALSYFWSVNIPFWAERVRVRTPFFVLPFAFANLPVLTQRQYKLVLYLLVWTMVVLCIGVGIHFLLNFDNIIDDLQHGRPVPVPRNHIRFNLLVVTAIFSGGWLWAKGFWWRSPKERWALAAAVLFLFAFLHVLSVRSGIVAMYAVLLYTAGWLVWQTRRWKIALAVAALVLAGPFIALKTLPSLQQRLGYMRYDWEQYKKNAGSHYSDSERFVSLSAGLKIWRESPLLGAGAGDLPMEVQRIVNDDFPQYTLEPKLPHNQFLYILASTGLLGLVLSFFAFFAPLSMRQNRRFYPLVAFQVMVFVSFLVEYTIETAIGVAFYLFYTLWFWKMSKGED